MFDVKWERDYRRIMRIIYSVVDVVWKVWWKRFNCGEFRGIIVSFGELVFWSFIILLSKIEMVLWINYGRMIE